MNPINAYYKERHNKELKRKHSQLRAFMRLKGIHLEPNPFDMERDLKTPTFKFRVVTITPEKVFQLSASGENEESSSDNKQAPTTTTLDTTTPTRVTEFAPKKSIDTFGPRTSIYHGAFITASNLN
ncbi:long-chain acyl-CoA synthetase [Vigna unguiculata]|uniref:Long-chain acyl-CoA synthetase n=1 Tax=Vigna unguiculata TaxID=3917 RepID=A0A4D6KV25_VIGUN|nr:long-chain acyl-CoA synthetase [Vigna unguiculata]